LAPSFSGAAPAVVNGRNFAGQFDNGAFFADTALAAGTTRVIQLVNREFAIYTRATASSTPIAQGTLRTFAGLIAGSDPRHPQIIWDAVTNRFYYAITANEPGKNTIFAFGWSTGPSPSNGTTHWCKYVFFGNPGSERPDFPSLGDSRDLMVWAANIFDASGSNFVRSDAFLVRKPAAGSTCPNGASLDITRSALRHGLLQEEFGPAVANALDTDQFGQGYIITRNLSLPSNTLYVHTIFLDPEFGPSVDPGHTLTLPFSYDAPPDATQAGFSQKLDTGRAEPTQAVLAANPNRGNALSLWTQHTVKNGSVSAVRWYEINPTVDPPILRRRGLIAAANTFIFNASIAPDRRVDGATKQFGGSFVIQFNRSGAAKGFKPHIRLGSSVNGGALSFRTLVVAQGSYRSGNCPNAGNVCAWSKYSAVSPDPRPAISTRGVVWLSNQYAGIANPPTNVNGNWRTRIASVRP
jgi:hypothetical protein